MPYQNRIAYQSFIENKDIIESRWDKRFGDRMNELVFIGQYLDKEQIRTELESCLMTGEEIELMAKVKLTDHWPV
jgi:G3E family GTPase